jgi:serine/threonine-protein kinase RsbW
MKSRKIPCDVNHLADIRAFVREALQEYAVSDKAASAIVLSVEEICANVIIHGNQRNASQELEIRVMQKDHHIMVETRDEGTAFNPGSYTERSILDRINDRRRGGMGLMLVRRLMDRAEYEREGTTNIWRLIKYLNEVPVASQTTETKKESA